MARREIYPEAIAMDEDVLGNNAAFTCPKCGKVFLVAAFPPEKKDIGRPCPRCGGPRGFPPADSQRAYIEWNGNDCF